MTYATIPPQARDAFAKAAMEVSQAGRAFSGSFATTDMLKAAEASMVRAERLLRDTRRQLFPPAVDPMNFRVRAYLADAAGENG